MPRPSPDDPRGIAASTMEEVRREADRSAPQAKRAAELIEQIDLTKPDTYNYPHQVDVGVKQARAGLDDVADAVTAVAQATAELADSPEKQSLLQSADQLKAAVEQAKTAAQQIPAVDDSKTPDVVALNDPVPIKLQIKGFRSTLDAAAKVLGDIERTVQQLDQAGASQPERQKLAAALTDLQKKWQPLKKLDKVEQQAQRLDASQPATYDARADLAQYAEQLLASLQALNSGLAHVHARVSQREIMMTQPQHKTVEPALENAEQGLKALSQPTEQTFNYARKLWPHPQLAPAQVEVRKEEAARIGEVFVSAHQKIQFLNTALATIIQPPQLTVDILCVICDSIWPDPNIAYILNYNQQTINDLIRAPEGEEHG